MKSLDNEGEEEFVEQGEKVFFFEVLGTGGNKCVDIKEGQILEDCSDNIFRRN